MGGSSVTRDKERPKKLMKKLSRDLEANGLYIDMTYDRTLCCRLIHVADTTLWGNAGCCCCCDNNYLLRACKM